MTTSGRGLAGRVFKWVGLAVLVLLLAGSLLMNVGLLGLLSAQGFAGDESSRFREVTVEGTGPDKAALVPLKGFIGKGSGDRLLPGRGTAQTVVAQLRRAARDDAVKAVLLEIDSPGGSVAASDLIHHEVRKVRAAGKPVIASIGDMGTSGAYYVAVAADRIIAQPTAVTGNIGVILHGMNIEGLLEKIGVRDVTYKEGSMKDILSPTRPATPEEEEVIRNLTDAVYRRFTALVAEGRGLGGERVAAVSDGRILVATEAKEAGLIDGIGYLDDALAEAAGLAGVERLRLVRYDRLFSLRDLLGASSRDLSPWAGLGDAVLEASSPRLLSLWTGR
ncbi:MAG: signal peptide peptidase SppA [bacterium]|nr:signal peptide peptidase SppA [bacterium]